jgi:N-acetylglutamate synthase-like GNAT family acetyltransferase
MPLGHNSGLEAFRLVAHIRRARPEEGGLLTELTIRSKGHWGYEESFLTSAREELEFQVGKFLPDFHVYVLELDGELAGFCSLIAVDDGTMELHDLFIEPRHIGKGYGKELWDHAVKLARELRFRRLILTADPNAEAFYASRVAVRIGERVSPVRSGRMPPVMEYIVPE